VILEKALIAKIRRLAASRTNSRVLTGIGDDCAVLRLTGNTGNPADVLVTTDFSLEGVHFRRDWHPAASVGHRCLARGLSDIAAMGGNPVAAFLSLALPPNLSQAWIGAFIAGLLRLGKKYGVTLAGGDTAQSPNGILADIVVLGTAPKGKALLRSGACPGDRLYVTGELGGSAAALRMMEERLGKEGKLRPNDYPRHFFPDPRLEVGRILREKSFVTAMVDTSDGLSTDLAHICEESGVGAELQAESIPRAKVGKPRQLVSLELALHGGEDYELLFTAPTAKKVPSRIAGVKVTQIGCIIRERRMFLETNGKTSVLKPAGWEHFAKSD
jgi:thiamine-monophosphate kinase